MTPQQPVADVRLRWLILAAMLLVLIMAPLDASAVNIILPVLQQDFHLTIPQVAWVSLSYLVILASFILPIGRIGDLFGFRRLYLLGAVIFTLASLACALAVSFPMLIAARIVQAMGACMLMAISSGITTAIFPAQERGRALGIVGMAVAVGSVLGPSLGGWLTALGGWRLVFMINLPIGIIGSLGCFSLLPAIRPNPGRQVDWSGGLLGMFMLGSLVLVITQGATWGWTASLTLALLAVSVISGVLFVWQERHCASPMLDFRLFQHPVFLGANIALVMNYLGQYCAIFLAPQLLEVGLRLPINTAGLVMITLPAAIFVLAPISGALSDRIGTRVLTVVGESLVTAGLAWLALTAKTPQLVPLIFGLLLIGIGAGLFQSPNNSAIMGSVPPTHLGIGGGVLATMRNLGMALGITVSSLVVSAGSLHAQGQLLLPPNAALLHGIHLAFACGAIFAALGAVTSLLRADQRKSSTLFHAGE